MSAQAKHTPGPWVASEDANGEEWGVDTAYDPCWGIATCAACPGDGTAEANATLIAAAPELLAALERTLSWLTSYQGGGTMGIDGPYEQARAAIAKATGAQP